MAQSISIETTNIRSLKAINGNILKLGVETNDIKIAVIAVYAPSQGQDVEFFLKVRSVQLNCEEPHQLICGDFNTTLYKILGTSPPLTGSPGRSFVSG